MRSFLLCFFRGNYSEAHVYYERGLQDNTNTEHIFVCKSGIARTEMYSGNYKRGVNVTLELNNKQLFIECAEILEKKKQLADAAFLFEKGESYDKAAVNYIKLKNWQKVGEILVHITSPKIHLQYAKARESEGKYEEALKAYTAAKDFDSVIRLHLDYLNNPEEAVELVQETKSVEGAKLVSRLVSFLEIIHMYKPCPISVELN